MRLDFSRRAHLSELMDEPCPYEVLRACLLDLERLNRITFGYRPTLEWLEQVVQRARTDKQLHIVDVGSGGGDVLRRVERWAARKKLAVRLTGIDLNANAIRAAREFTPAWSRIRWIDGEAFAFDTNADPVDLVISSLFAHHLTDEEIPRFIAWMEHVARRGWLITDLCRNRASYEGYKALMFAMPWHPFLRHDGLASFRRALVPDEWRQYMKAAGVQPDEVSIYKRRPGRLCLARVKAQ